MKFNYGRIFLLGFGFFGVSVLNALYNSYVPNFLQSKFGLSSDIIGIFMALDNIAALFIQPVVGVWSDRVRTSIGRRMPFILIGVPVSAVAFGFIPIASILPFFVASTTSFFLAMAFWRTPVVASDARYYAISQSFTGKWHHQLDGRSWRHYCLSCRQFVI